MKNKRQQKKKFKKIKSFIIATEKAVLTDADSDKRKLIYDILCIHIFPNQYLPTFHAKTDSAIRLIENLKNICETDKENA